MPISERKSSSAAGKQEPLLYAYSLTFLRENSEEPMMGNDHFTAMVMDVLSERGYHVSFDRRLHHVPVRVDLRTGKIELDTHHIYLLTVEYPKHYIRALEQKFK